MLSMGELRCQLSTALNASGYQIEPNDNRLTLLSEKLDLLQAGDRYARLLAGIFAANDSSNFRSLVLEATFAFHFESAGMPLIYEESPRQDNETSVDFLHHSECGKDIYIEMRLVQQRQVLTTLFEEQLRHTGYFEATLDGNQDQFETIRLQQSILEKAVNRNGELIKFADENANNCNIVAIEVSELHLGMIDDADCILASYGDPAVPEHVRRRLFGLFQEPSQEYPDDIRDVATRFAPFRRAVHAILFLRKVPPSHPIDYSLEYIMVPNKSLLSNEETHQIAGEFCRAMNVWESVCNRD